MSRLVSPLLPALVVGALAAPAFGWGADAHRITAVIAERYLTEETRSAIRELLGAGSLADATTWADEIRDDPRYDWSKPLHYVNMPRGATSFDLERDCADRRCVVAAIDDFTDRLRSGTATRSERLEALRFLVHLVGDVHQPLHACYGDDRGGNDVDLVFFGEPTNLHKLWDTDLLRRRDRGDWRGHARAIASAVTETQVAEWREATRAEDWANESFAIAREYAYPADGSTGAAYYERCIPVVEERLAAAGVRMAERLNRVFAERGGGGEAAGGGDEAAGDPGKAGHPVEAGGVDPGGARGFVSIVRDGACGDGERVFLVNRHESHAIRVRVRLSWTAGDRPGSSERTYTLRPGGTRRSLGCSRRRMSGGETRDLTWEIVEATF